MVKTHQPKQLKTVEKKPKLTTAKTFKMKNCNKKLAEWNNYQSDKKRQNSQIL